MAQQGYLSFQWVKVPSAEPSKNCLSHIHGEKGDRLVESLEVKASVAREILVRKGDGNVGIIRSPLRAIALPAPITSAVSPTYRPQPLLC
jgi:hypothetical protein